ncbi:hypothetical protein [Rhodoligotrophos defluvii]|uniref:hypothetical protein n=1 Tax=Rhodoligotrophos defluvii TaxID=2561934 RepID=UPI0014859225|nr:hypothetical protein [Rhodoligotrophos defluvii]
MKRSISIPDTKVVCILRDADRWKIYDGVLVIINPDHPPRVVDLNTGEERELRV